MFLRSAAYNVETKVRILSEKWVLSLGYDSPLYESENLVVLETQYRAASSTCFVT
jgi:hypothetical protein